MKTTTKLSMDDGISQMLLNAALEIKKNAPTMSFSVILGDLIEGIENHVDKEAITQKSK